MRPLHLRLHNFQSYRELDLDLSGISLAVLSGPNGSGKSSLIDAVRFCLWGYARGGNLDTVVTTGQQVCLVELTFLLAGHTYMVSRQRSSKGSGSTTLSFECDGVSLTGKSVAETQQVIIDTLHMTDELFCVTACSDQGHAGAFAEATATERRQVLAAMLGLEVWEVRAKLARAMHDKLEAKRDDSEAASATAEVKADTLPGIVTQIAALEQELAILSTAQDKATADAAAVQVEREGLIAGREADKAARAELVTAQAQLTKATETVTRRQQRVTDLEGLVAIKPATVLALATALAADKQAGEMEQNRLKREGLEAEARTLSEQIKAAKVEHAAAVTNLQTQIAAAKLAREQRLEALDDALGGLRKQAAVLESVPCVQKDAKPLADACPLIAQARDARERIPTLEAEQGEVVAATPWAEDEKRVEAWQAQEPGAELVAERARLKARYDAIVYDAEAHSQAQTRAEKLQSLRDSIARIAAQEEQLPAAAAELGTAQAEETEFAEKVRALTVTLGEQRDWDTDLGALDQRAKACVDEQGRLRRQIEMAQQRSGTLAEQKAAAEAAAEEVKRLQEEITAAERRAHLLHILGNPQDGGFSRKGVPALLIEQAVPELQEEANRVLAMLSNGRLSVELRTQADGANGLRETLDIVVNDEYGQRLLETFSGGEAMRVFMGLRAALSLLLARRAGAQCSTLILDETAAPLDARGQEQFVEAVGGLSAFFELVLVVSHLDSLKDQFPCRLEISKGADGSQVEVIAA